MKYLAIIPARGGSKGVPQKNIKPLNGKPLIHYTIEAAGGVFEDADICVSTDSEEIKEVAEKKGIVVPFLRPDALATDTAGSYEVLLHAVDFYEKQGRCYDAIVLLQPTSPFRTSKHIKEAMALFSTEVEMVVAVKETASNPYYVLFEENKQGFLEQSKKGNFTRRQDCPEVWEYNGAIYVINTMSLKKKNLNLFEKVVKYPMGEEESLDIDTEFDFDHAEFILARKNKR